MVKVEAPCRILISGQSMSWVVPVTDCWDVAVEREKKPEILSVKEGELDAGGAAVEVPVAVADGVPRRLVPEQPDASSASNSKVALDAQWLRRITPGSIKWVFRRIPPTHRLDRDTPNLIAKEPWPSQGALLASGEGQEAWLRPRSFG
ncbi:MAG TPA: hypothetical protein VK749_00450 [Xanthobacteraceae bacterium]|nr:hypothetical protein [Xanthobacteraceae bacterium]